MIVPTLVSDEVRHKPSFLTLDAKPYPLQPPESW